MRRLAVATMVAAAAALTLTIAPSRAAETWNVAVLDGEFRNGTCAALEQGSVTSVRAGDSVTWTSCSDAPHDVTSDDAKFPQKSLPGKGSTATQQFDTAGNYGYKCSIHGFSGTVVVEPSTPATTQATVPPTTATTARTPTTARPTTTTTPASTTTVDFGAMFDPDSTPSTTETTVFSTATTRALGSGGDNGTSAGLVALLIVGLGAVGTAGALLIRRMRAAGPVGPS